MSVGRLIAGRYRLLKELGHGGMGSVWTAEHLELRTQVAIKLIEPLARALPGIEHRFAREARALAALRSPHVVQVLDYGVDEGAQYLVMELLQGETLRSRLQARSPLPASEVWTIVQHVGRALSVSHAAGFVHRDLKPDNIFITGSGDEVIIKVLDFGIAKALAAETTNLTATGALLGTCHYMSPEQATDGGKVDLRSDLWSLGVVAFECLTGQRPFEGLLLQAVLAGIRGGPVVVPSRIARVPAGFDDWFARAVCRDVDQRFQTTAELVRAAQNVLKDPKEWVDQNRSDALAPHDEVTVVNGPERRLDTRFRAATPASVNGGRDLDGSALVSNASRSGALLATRKPCDMERVIELEIHTDGPSVGQRVRARVVRVCPRQHPLWRFDVGVRFERPLPRALLSRLAAGKKP